VGKSPGLLRRRIEMVEDRRVRQVERTRKKIGNSVSFARYVNSFHGEGAVSAEVMKEP
jgi:hypothetical protein